MFWFWASLLVVVCIFGLVVFRGAPYLPSQKKYVKLALTKLYPISKNDVLVDVGSGDGIVLREASKRGARAVGFEINPILVILSRFLARNDKRIRIRLVDFWLSHLPDDTTVVYVFSVGRDMRKIVNWIQNETTRIGHPISLISFGFGFGDMKVTKKVEPYYLYVFHPLQQVQAQV